MSTNVTDDQIKAAITALDEQPIPYPRKMCFDGIHVRVQSPDHPPEFLNDENEWQVLELVGPECGCKVVRIPSENCEVHCHTFRDNQRDLEDMIGLPPGDFV